MDIYGKIRKLEGAIDFVPFRYQGQYEDVESGLYYNRFGYYCAETGRYLSQDPIGLLGGAKFYAFTKDSIAAVDIFGLSPIVVIGEGQGAVDAVAKVLSDSGYDAESMMYPKVQWKGGKLYDGMPISQFEKSVEWNKQWLKDKISEGYKVVDIGGDGRVVRSEFYKAELEAIKEMNSTKITLKKLPSGESINDMRTRIKCG